MDNATNGIGIIAAFALAHERVIELIRWVNEQAIKKRSVPLYRWIDAATAGPWAGVTGMIFAIATNANLLYAFQSGADKFAKSYLAPPPKTPNEWFGCALMGLAVALGSSFWHDFSKGLIETRDKIKGVDSSAAILKDTATAPPATDPRRNAVTSALTPATPAPPATAPDTMGIPRATPV